jgi:hypothetical protein
VQWGKEDMKNRGLPIALAIFLLLPLVAAKADPTRQELMSKASKYFILIKKKDFKGASNLFYYPPHYSQSRTLEDLNTVSKMLAVLTDEFGPIIKNEICETYNQSYYEVGVFGGDVSDYEKDKPHAIELTYKIEFEKEGSGFVIIGIWSKRNLSTIRYVSYALPVERPDTKDRLRMIMQKMVQIIGPSVRH